MKPRLMKRIVRPLRNFKAKKLKRLRQKRDISRQTAEEMESGAWAAKERLKGSLHPMDRKNWERAQRIEQNASKYYNRVADSLEVHAKRIAGIKKGKKPLRRPRNLGY